MRRIWKRGNVSSTALREDKLLPRGPSPIVLAARARRGNTAAAREARIQWAIDKVLHDVNVTLFARVKLATNLVRDRVVSNIGKPVTITRGPRGGRVVTNRSRKGEYPRLETGRLRNSIFTDTRVLRKGLIDGYIGTDLDYGLILEMRMERLFLQRSLEEMTPIVRTLITRRIVR